MATQNKVTKLYPIGGVTITECIIQNHFDELNADGWELVCLDNVSGWYRFFWKKEVASE